MTKHWVICCVVIAWAAPLQPGSGRESTAPAVTSRRSDPPERRHRDHNRPDRFPMSEKVFDHSTRTSIKW
jgi:hypothetical protein